MLLIASARPIDLSEAWLGTSRVCGSGGEDREGSCSSSPDVPNVRTRSRRLNAALVALEAPAEERASTSTRAVAGEGNGGADFSPSAFGTQG